MWCSISNQTPVSCDLHAPLNHAFCVIFYHIISYHIIFHFFYILSYYIMAFIIYYNMLCHIISYYIKLYDINNHSCIHSHIDDSFHPAKLAMLMTKPPARKLSKKDRDMYAIQIKRLQLDIQMSD